MGDSHAAALASGWRQLKSIDQYTASGCPPILNIEIDNRFHCKKINDSVAEIIKIKNYKTVILHANWVIYGEEKYKIKRNY